MVAQSETGNAFPSAAALAEPVIATGPSRLRLAFDFMVVALIWGSTWLVIKDQISTVPPGWAITWRFVVAAIGMVVLALLRRESLRLDRTGALLAIAVGLLQFCGNFQMVYRAEHHLTSGIVAVFYALLMVANAVLAWLFLRAQSSGRFLAGSAVAVAGVAVLMLHEYRTAPDLGGNVPLGVALALGGLLCASAANVLQATDAARHRPIVPLLTWAMIAGALADAVLAWAMHGPPVIDPRPASLAGIVYLGLAGSVITFPLYFGLIRHMGAARAAYNGVAVPVVAMALSTVFEDFRWSTLAAGGSALAITGLLIALSGRR